MSVAVTPSPIRAGRPRIGLITAAAALAVVAAELQREVWTTSAIADAQRLPIAGLAALMTVAVAVSRRATLPAVTTGFAVLLLVDVVGSPWEVAPMFGFATAPLAYMLGRWTTGRARLSGTLVAASALVIVAVRFAASDTTADYSIGSAITQVALSMAPIWLGATMRDRAALHAALGASAARAAADRDSALARTVLDERARIAGELHDLIAHALSAVVVQASAARIHAPQGTPAAAAAFGAIEATGRDALTEIRSVLDVLRAPGDLEPGAPLEPQPRVERVPALLARAGIEAHLKIEGEPRPLPASVDLNAYRVVQEAVASAERHGATTVTVGVSYEPAGLVITLSDDGAPARPPLATRERVRLYGGELLVQTRRGEAGVRVRARLPIAVPA